MGSKSLRQRRLQKMLNELHGIFRDLQREGDRSISDCFSREAGKGGAWQKWSRVAGLVAALVIYGIAAPATGQDSPGGSAPATPPPPATPETAGEDATSEETTAEESGGASEAVAGGADGTDDGGQEAEDDGRNPGSEWERLIYLPYRQLKDVFQKHGSTVFLPYAEYLRHWRDAGKPDPESTVDAVITESHYTARVDRSLLRIQAQLHVQVLGKPWVSVPVRFGSAAVGSVSAEEGQQVLLKGTGDGTYDLLFGQSGEHIVDIELAAPIKTSPDGRHVEFNVPSVGVTTFELTIPEPDQTVEISPHLVALPVEDAEEGAKNETRVRANLGSTTTISADWHPRTSQKPEMDLLAAVSNYQRVMLRDGLVHTDAWLNYDILRGEMTELAVAVPSGHRILGVSSDNAKMRSWRTEGGDDRQTLRVEFLSPVRERVMLEVHTEREFGPEPIELAGRAAGGEYRGIHAVDAVRESGQIAVAAADDLSLQFEQISGLVRIENQEIHQSIRQNGAAAFKFYSPNIRLRLLAKPVEPRLLLGSQYDFRFEEDELKVTSDLSYDIERAGVFEFRIALPVDIQVDRVDARSNHRVREFHIDEIDEEDEEEDGRRVLRVVMQQKTAAPDTVRLHLSGHVSFEEALEEVELTLPVPDPLDVERETAEVYVLAPESLEVITRQEDIVSAQPFRIPRAQSQAGYRVASAWSFNRRPVEIPVRTKRRPTRLSAQAATTITVKEEITQVVADLTYVVEYAGLDVFRFAVPEGVSDRIQISSLEGSSAPAIRQKQPADEAVGDWVTWTVTMQRDVVGQHRFRVTWDLKPESNAAEEAVDDDVGGQGATEGDGDAAADADEDTAQAPDDAADDAADAAADEAGGDAAADADSGADDPGVAEAEAAGDAASSEEVQPETSELLFRTVRVLGLDGSGEDGREVPLSSVYGEIVVQKDRSLSVHAEVPGEDAETAEAIDVRELTLLPQSGSLAWRYFSQPVELRIEATKHEIQKVVETVVTRGLVEIVTRRDTHANYRCRYRLRSSERQRLRVDVPVGSELLGVFVDGQQVSPEKNTQPMEEEGWNSYFVNVARRSSSDEPFSLTLQMMTPVDVRAPFKGWGGKLLLRLPQIGGFDNPGVVLQQLQTVIWTPEDYRLLGESEGFTHETRLDLTEALTIRRRDAVDPFDPDAWVNVQPSGFIDFPTEGNRFRYSSLGDRDRIIVTWASQPNYTWLFSGALIVIAILLRGLSWDTKLLLLLVGAFALVLFGLSSPGWAAEIVSAARFGIYALIGIWVLHSILSWKPSDAAREPRPPGDSSSRPQVGAAHPVVIPPPGVFDDHRQQFGK